MSDITLAKSLIHNYDGPNGRELYEHDKKVILHLLRAGNRDLGYMSFIVDEVGSYCYKRVQILYEGSPVFNAQETSSGDWWVSWCSLPLNSSLWKYIFNA